MSERDDIAKVFHNIYLMTAKAFHWPIRPEVDVEFDGLSKDAQELDYALADFHLAEIARLRAEVERLKNRSYTLPDSQADVQRGGSWASRRLPGAGVMRLRCWLTHFHPWHTVHLHTFMWLIIVRSCCLTCRTGCYA